MNKSINLSEAKVLLSQAPVTKAVLRAVLEDVSEMDLDFITRMGVLKLNVWELFQCDFSELTNAEHLNGSALEKFCRTISADVEYVYFDLDLHSTNGKQIFKFPKHYRDACYYGQYRVPMKCLNPKPAQECFVDEDPFKISYINKLDHDGFERECISNPSGGTRTVYRAHREGPYEFQAVTANTVTGDIVSTTRQWHTHTSKGCKFFSFITVGKGFEQRSSMEFDRKGVLRKLIEVNGDIIIFDSEGDRVLRSGDESMGVTIYEHRWDMKLVSSATSTEGYTDFEYELDGDWLKAYRVNRFGKRTLKCTVKQP